MSVGLSSWGNRGMAMLQRIRNFLSRLVHRPADLFDIASGLGTTGFVVLAAWNYGNTDEVAPSMSFLDELAPTWVWMTVVLVAAVLQPIALHADDPLDPRHPIVQWRKWLRNILALIVGSWFAILYWSLWVRVGPHHIEALYLMVAGMNAYIVAHVLFRAHD